MRERKCTVRVCFGLIKTLVEKKKTFSESTRLWIVFTTVSRRTNLLHVFAKVSVQAKKSTCLLRKITDVSGRCASLKKIKVAAQRARATLHVRPKVVRFMGKTKSMLS